MTPAAALLVALASVAPAAEAPPAPHPVIAAAVADPQPLEHHRLEAELQEAADRRFQRVSTWALIAASTADMVSTEFALSQGGNYEANPLMGNSSRFQRIAVKAAGTAFLVWWTNRAKTEHSRTASWARLAVAGGFSALAVHNTRLGLRSK